MREPKRKKGILFKTKVGEKTAVVDDGQHDYKIKLEEEKIKLQASQDEKKMKEQIKRNKNVLIYVAVAVAGFFAYKKFLKK